MSTINTNNLNKFSTFNLILKLFNYISSKYKKDFVVLIFLTLINSFFELISLASIIPFLLTLLEPSLMSDYNLFGLNLINFFNILKIDFFVGMVFFFIIAISLSGLIRLYILWFGLKLSNQAGAELSNLVFTKAMYMSYDQHIDINSSDIISSVSLKFSTVMSVLISLIRLVSSFFLIVSIFSLTIYLNPVISLISFLTFGLFYILISFFSKSAIRRFGNVIALEQTRAIKVVQEGIGSIRDIILNNTFNYFTSQHKESIMKQNTNAAYSGFINQSPRIILEIVGMVMISAYAFILMSFAKDISLSLSYLGAFVYASLRLLPLMQQFYAGWAGLTESRAAVLDILSFLTQPSLIYNQDNNKKIFFNNNIEFKNVSFTYKNSSKLILKNFNNKICKGDKVGIKGDTGSGKSTLVDLLMGLLRPTKGYILVDDKNINTNLASWQNNISHVPQNIFLADASIAENIAFGIPKKFIDYEKVKKAAISADIHEVIEGRPNKYNELVGEKGIKLSGGQRQRIGIARALYKDATIIIFDEATNALDELTEKNVLSTIFKLDKDITIVIISHKSTNLNSCNNIIKLS